MRSLTLILTLSISLNARRCAGYSIPYAHNEHSFSIMEFIRLGIGYVCCANGLACRVPVTIACLCPTDQHLVGRDPILAGRQASQAPALDPTASLVRGERRGTDGVCKKTTTHSQTFLVFEIPLHAGSCYAPTCLPMTLPLAWR